MNKKLLLSLMYCMSVHGADTSAEPADTILVVEPAARRGHKRMHGDPEVIEGVEFFSAPDRRPRAATQGPKLRPLTEPEIQALVISRGLPRRTIHQASTQYMNNGRAAVAFATATNKDLQEEAQLYQRRLELAKQRRDSAHSQVLALSAAQEATLAERAGDPEILRNALTEFVRAPKGGDILSELDHDALVRYALEYRRIKERNRIRSLKPSNPRPQNPRKRESSNRENVIRRASLDRGEIIINWPADTSEEDQRDALRYYRGYSAPLAAPDTPELVQKYAKGYRKKIRDERERKQRAQAAHAQEKE